MGVPSPVIPSFSDGTVVHQADLNALASNLTNLYNYNQAGFVTQRPTVMVTQTSGQSIANATDVLVNFQSASINTDNMWTASVANQILIQHAGIYFLFAQVMWPSVAGMDLSKLVAASILVNGTSTANAVAFDSNPAIGDLNGQHIGVFANLAVNATVYLDVYQTTTASRTLSTLRGGSFFGAVFLTSSS